MLEIMAEKLVERLKAEADSRELDDLWASSSRTALVQLLREAADTIERLEGINKDFQETNQHLAETHRRNDELKAEVERLEEWAVAASELNTAYRLQDYKRADRALTRLEALRSKKPRKDA